MARPPAFPHTLGRPNAGSEADSLMRISDANVTHGKLSRGHVRMALQEYDLAGILAVSVFVVIAARLMIVKG